MRTFLAASETSGAHVLPAASPTVWLVFSAFVAVVLALDLFVLNRKHEEPSLRKSALQVGMFVSLAAAVAISLYLFTDFGGDGVGQFVAAYVTEWSLSVDNIFVIAVVMTYFGVPRAYQHKVLFWGIIGALIMRLGFIAGGLALIQVFSLLTAILGAFLIWTAWKVATSDDEDPDVSQMRSYKLFTRVFPTTETFVRDKFFARDTDGRLKATPLFICVLVVEVTDLVFAIDSIPAVLAISTNSFIAFSSNVMALMGLRSIFFLYGHVQDKVSRLNEGLGLILAFVGLKMIAGNATVMGWVGLEPYHLPTWISLTFIVSVLILSVVASIVWPKKDELELEIGEDAPAADTPTEKLDTVDPDATTPAEGLHAVTYTSDPGSRH